MTTIILINFFIFLIVGSIGIFKGLDLKKWKSWLIGIYGFVSGFLIILLRGDKTDITVGFQIGAIFAFTSIFAGACTYYQRRFFKSEKFQRMINKSSSLLSRGDKTQDISHDKGEK
jgi:hypothetical protein